MTTTPPDPALGGKVRRGFVWSAISSSVLRLGTLLVGIVLARLLSPDDFGVYAIALTVQTIVINLAELGLAADLVRHGDLRRRGPTITSVSMLSSSGLTVLMCASAGPFAALMGAPDAAPVIMLMALTLPMAGLTVVPYAHLQREFQQGRLFAIDLVNFALGTGVTLTLAVAGWGPISLALGRVAGQLASTGLQFALTGHRLRFGWNGAIAASGIRFGLPLACAGVLSWTLLNVDNVIVGATAGTVLLGYYVLAFNVSSWPSSVLGTAVQAVAFPAFSQRGRGADGRDVDGVIGATAVVWAGSLPAGIGLALLAEPVVELLYGARWLPAAAALAGLAYFGALRVVFDLWVAFLTACGAAPALLGLQLLWLAVLAPALYVGLRLDGIAGAAWSHPVVAVGLMLPAHLVVLRRHGVPIVALVRAFVPATAAAVPAAVACRAAAAAVDGTFWRLAAGGAALAVTYAVLILPWLRAQRAALKQPPAPVGPAEPITQGAP